MCYKNRLITYLHIIVSETNMYQARAEYFSRGMCEQNILRVKHRDEISQNNFRGKNSIRTPARRGAASGHGVAY